MSVLTEFFSDRIPTQISLSKKEVLFAHKTSQSGVKVLIWQDWGAQKKEDLISSWLRNSFLCVSFFLSGRLLISDQKAISQQQWVFITLTARISTKWEYLPPQKKKNSGKVLGRNLIGFARVTWPFLIQSPWSRRTKHTYWSGLRCASLPGAKGKVSPAYPPGPQMRAVWCSHSISHPQLCPVIGHNLCLIKFI